jgi:hypothetical protein
MSEMRFNEPMAEPIKEAEKVIEPEKVEGKIEKSKKPETKSYSVDFKNILQKFKIKKQNVFAALLAIVVLTSLVFGGNFYLKAKKLERQSQTAAAGSAGEAQRIVAEVGKLLILPTDEEPTIATISDASKLQNQAFFANAKNGDKVLIYNKAGKAILYDPVNKIIVEVAPLNTDAPTNQ